MNVVQKGVANLATVPNHKTETMFRLQAILLDVRFQCIAGSGREVDMVGDLYFIPFTSKSQSCQKLLFVS